MHKRYYKHEISVLTPYAKWCKKLVVRTCNYIAQTYNVDFTCSMSKIYNAYEGVIMSNRELVFWGGHFSVTQTSHRNGHGVLTPSCAWVSLAEDVIGIGELKEQHSLQKMLHSIDGIPDDDEDADALSKAKPEFFGAKTLKDLDIQLALRGF